MAWSKTSRHARGYDSAWDKLRLRILKRDQHLCQACLAKGRITPATHVDHIIPKANGGTDDDANLQALDAQCHAEKTAAEGAAAQGRTVKQRISFNPDGSVIWPT